MISPMPRMPAAIKIAPKNRGAYAGRLRLALAAGQTAQAQTIAAEIAQLWPDDAAARNQDAYLRLLLGASDGVAEAAERDAEVLVRKEPRNWLARATLGLARLRLGRNKDALAAFRAIRVTGNEPPGALAVRAAILAVNGYEEGARNDARILGSANRFCPKNALSSLRCCNSATQPFRRLLSRAVIMRKVRRRGSCHPARSMSWRYVALQARRCFKRQCPAS